MNKERLKKLIYDLDVTDSDINKSIRLIKKYSDDVEMIEELSNSLKYKYLSLFIIYEDFISMLLKEYNLYEIAMSVDKAIKKLKILKVSLVNLLKVLNNIRKITKRILAMFRRACSLF